MPESKHGDGGGGAVPVPRGRARAGVRGGATGARARGGGDRRATTRDA